MVLLEDRVLTSPQDHRIVFPTAMLAWAVAFEWDLQSPTIRPFNMHMVCVCAEMKR